MKSRRLFACVFTAVLLFFAVQNAELVMEPIRTALDKEEGSGFVQFRDDVQKAFQSDGFSMKTAFVDLNGLASKWMGKRVINDTIVLNNGMLAFANEDPYPMEEIAGHLTGLHTELEQMGIPFLYVQMPHKLDEESTLLPLGTKSGANWNVDLLLKCLDESGVQFLDLRDGQSRKREEIDQYFFKTDHHWNFDGAFVGFERIAQRLQDTLGDRTDISMYIDKDNWEKRSLDRPFLGSQGVRVGQYVVGLDQIEYYVPRFNTDMTCMIHESRKGVHSDFEGTLIRQKKIEAQEGKYLTNAYVVYIGSDYRLVSHRNAHAPVKKKILLIKDSFSLPIQSYLSTVYAEIDVIDKRSFRECSILEYAMRMQPDVVMMAASPTTFGEAFYYDYGYADVDQIRSDMAKQEMLLENKEICLDDPGEEGCVLYEGFQEDAVYTLSFENTYATDEETDFLTASLLDPASGRHVYSWVFDLKHSLTDGDFIWTFRTPKENAGSLRLVLFTGQPDGTGEKRLSIESIMLWKGAI